MPDVLTCEDARAKGLKFYFTGRPCLNGHVAQRFVRNHGCAQCITERRAAGPWRAYARDVTTDYSHLSQEQIDSWYETIRNIRSNANQYRHHPLEERPIIYQPPPRRVTA